MAAYVQFLSKETGEAVSFIDIDNALCAFLGVDPDPVYYAYGWYNNIGFAVATGQDVDKMIAGYVRRGEELPEGHGEKQFNQEMGEVLPKIWNWLKEHYTPKGWTGF